MTPSRLIARTAPADRLIYGIVAAWVLAMIGVPILRWVFGDGALPYGVAVGVLLQVLAVLVILVHAWGARRALLTVTMVIACAWLVEYSGHTTGFPFGSYDYTNRLQPQLGGVPLLIPLAWLMMLPPAWAVAHRIARRFSGLRGKLAFVAASAIAFTAWDLFLDPQMVAWNLWVWDDPGAFSYFGIPWVNFLGWLLASAAITAIAARIAPLRHLPARPLIAIYIITWMLETIGQLFFWALPGPALVGFAAMGVVLLVAWRSRRD